MSDDKLIAVYAACVATLLMIATEHAVWPTLPQLTPPTPVRVYNAFVWPLAAGKVYLACILHPRHRGHRSLLAIQLSLIAAALTELNVNPVPAWCGLMFHATVIAAEFSEGWWWMLPFGNTLTNVAALLLARALL